MKRDSQTQFDDFESAFHYSGIGIGLVAPDGSWLRVNRALTEIVGYTEEELLALDFQTITHADDLEKDLSLVQEVLAGKRRSYRMEKRYWAKDGRLVWILLTVSLVRHPDGTPKYFISQIQDISNEKRSIEALRKNNQELERSNRELGDFARAAGHDLRSPLRGVQMLVDMMVEDYADALPDRCREQLLLVKQRVTRMEALLKSLLQYARVGADVDDIRVVKVRRLLESQIELLGKPDGYRVDVDCPESLEVSVAVTPLAMVVRNLIENCIKHRSESGRMASVRAREQGPFLEVVVSDDGPGIPAELREKVFALFRTLRRRDDLEASGVGLAMVKKAVEVAGGSIEICDGEAGRGVTFRLAWPTTGS
ncbi:MAG: PAS domain S-box protein [Planctomycetes bacterium]|nr:PAS domain S-box protein [Planctomycetota bacterium]